MKTFVRIIAIALIAVFSLTLLTSCGKSMDKIVDKIKDLDEDDYRYQEAHRQSLNSVIQGSSADIMKTAMIAIYNDPRYKEYDMHMIITVHDELLAEIPEEHIKEGAEFMQEKMKEVGERFTGLPMKLDFEVTSVWYGEDLSSNYGL